MGSKIKVTNFWTFTGSMTKLVACVDGVKSALEEYSKFAIDTNFAVLSSTSKLQQQFVLTVSVSYVLLKQD